MSAAISVHLGGREGEITGDAFLNAGQALLDLVKGAARHAGDGRDDRKVTWTLGRLETGSATMGLAADGPGAATAAAREAIRDVMAGLAGLRQRPEMPAGFSEQMTRKARDLSRLAGRHGITDVTVDFLRLARDGGLRVGHVSGGTPASSHIPVTQKCNTAVLHFWCAC